MYPRHTHVPRRSAHVHGKEDSTYTKIPCLHAITHAHVAVPARANSIRKDRVSRDSRSSYFYQVTSLGMWEKLARSRDAREIVHEKQQSPRPTSVTPATVRVCFEHWIFPVLVVAISSFGAPPPPFAPRLHVAFDRGARYVYHTGPHR